MEEVARLRSLVEAISRSSFTMLVGLNGKIPWLLNPASVALETKSGRGHAGEEIL